MAKKRGRETAYDMVLSMGAVFVAVAVVLLVAWRPEKVYIQPVDYTGAITNAVLNSNWPVLVPNKIPTGYEVTSARFEVETYGDSGDTRWYLGYASTNEFISLWQSDGKVEQVKSAAIPNVQCSEVESIAGQSWQKCESADTDTRGYLKIEGDLIYLVSGTADWTKLQEFIESLKVAS